MELDGFLKLVDAQRNMATTRANVANTMADIATKVANLSLIREQALKARLDNVAKYLDIKWDANVRRDLLKVRNAARRTARQLEGNIQMMQDKIRHISAVLSGGTSRQAIRQGWIAFDYLRQHVLVLAATSIAQVPMPDDIYEPDQWFASDNNEIKPISSNERDFGHLVVWARKLSYVPKMQTTAWTTFASYIKALSDAAGAWASAVQKEAKEAAEAALALSKEDWDRLKGQLP